MAAVRSIFGRFFGNAVSTSAGVGIGGAVQNTLNPLTQSLANETWALHAVVPPDPYALANGVAQGQVAEPEARAWAAESGIGDAQFTALINIANAGPGVAEAFNLWRRSKIGEAGFRRALKRQALEGEWIDDLVQVKDVLLDPSVIANAVHRGIMRDPTLIVREPPTTPGKVEQVPPSPLDPALEAEGHGLTHERLRVEVGTTGLPPGLIQMLQLLNRGEVTVADVQRAVSQSNLRNEYMDVVLALRRQLLTAHEYEEAALRGVLTQAEADAGAALHGMTKEDARLLFEIMGRPLVVHQMTTGLARGGKFGGTYNDVPEPYRDAIRRSNIRPEYAGLAYANRYTYPSAFVLRSLVQSGDLTEAEGHQVLLDIGWPPPLAAKVSAQWAGGTGTKADTHAAKAQTQLWTTLHRSYLAGESTSAEVSAALPRAGVAAATVPEVLATWDEERTIIRKQLSPAQVKKAYTEGVVNPETGGPWTKDEATAALVARGYSTADATTFLEL